MVTRWTILVLVSYLLGSIPSSIWVCRLFFKKDIRQCGSGNAGATNVYRTFGWRLALFVALFDMFKGWLPVAVLAELPWFLDKLQPEHQVYAQLLAGFAAICGHVWTLFARFKGGKGVATAAGMLLALFPMALPICIMVFILTVWKTGYVSLGSILSSVSLPLILIFFHFMDLNPIPIQLLVFSLLIPIFIIWTHRSNLKRLRSGTESRIQRGG